MKTFSRQFLLSELAVLVYLALFKLFLHFLTNGQYGYHRDELLYLALGEHLDFGYVEVPPSIAIFANLSRWMFGDSLFALRFFAAVTGALMVLLTGLMARELGGGRFSQFLASLAVIVSPAYLRSHTLFQPVSFDQLYWVLGAFIVILFCKKKNPKFWLYLGLVAGIGLLNKYSMLLFYLFSTAGKPYRVLGWMYVVILLVLLAFQAKDYYLLPAYPMLFASGTLAIDRFIKPGQRYWLKPALVIFVVVNSMVVVPYGLPVLPIKTFEKYAGFMANHIGLSGPLRWETGKIERLPQDYADMFGWEDQVATVAKVYHGLSPEEQSQCIIFAGNYGEAGAIDYFGGADGLPKATSVNGSYYLWGPGGRSGEIVIALGVSREYLESVFDGIALVAVITHEYARENNLPVYVCRNPRITLQELWPQLKIYQY